MPSLKEPRFIAGPEGIADKKSYLLNELKDVQNQCGSKFNPSQEGYWRLMVDNLKRFSPEDLEYLYDQAYLMESGERIREAIRSVNSERLREYQNIFKHSK